MPFWFCPLPGRPWTDKFESLDRKHPKRVPFRKSTTRKKPPARTTRLAANDDPLLPVSVLFQVENCCPVDYVRVVSATRKRINVSPS